MSILLRTMHEEMLTLAKALSYPDPVIDPMLKAAEKIDAELPIQELAEQDTCQSAWDQISSLLPSWQEDQGMALLAATTAAACLARQNYRSLNIEDTVFLETMKAIPRFITESKDLFGSWVYDRGFWSWRQTGCLLFRLGTLEFEYRLLEDCEPLPQGLQVGDPVLSVHIPSDAKISKEALNQSYAWAKRFFFEETEGPWKQDPPKALICGTWLLADTLQQLLPETSGIRIFASDYQIYSRQQDSRSFFRWLYQLPAPVPYEELPEHTSLQRKLKAYLLSGGHMGEAHGILIF